jgi:hypothetical protein
MGRDQWLAVVNTVLNYRVWFICEVSNRIQNIAPHSNNPVLHTLLTKVRGKLQEPFSSVY